MEYQGGARTIDLQPPGPSGASPSPVAHGLAARDTSEGLLGIINHGWLQPGRPGPGEARMAG